MNNHAIIGNVSVATVYPPSASLFTTLVPSQSIPEGPGQFASLAHEIRNPLSTINLSAEMLRSMSANDDQKTFLDMIIRASARINDILTDIHSSFRPVEIKEQNYSIHELLDEVLAMAGDKITLKHITIRKNYAVKDCRIKMNRPKMKIALTNIVINAIDAMIEGKGELTLVTKSTDHKCVVQIEDNGCGISPANLKNIFKPYFTNKPDGLGLGLASTRAILLSNHVQLNVKSAVAKGTNFILMFEKNYRNRPLQQIRSVPGISNSRHNMSVS